MHMDSTISLTIYTRARQPWVWCHSLIRHTDILRPISWEIISRRHPGVGVTMRISSVPLFFFQCCQNTRYLLNITFIFDRCRRSSAAVAPVKYKCDSNNLRRTFARSKILLTEKLTKGALVTPTLGPEQKVILSASDEWDPSKGSALGLWCWDKRVVFCRRHFQMNFLKRQWKRVNVDFLDACSEGFILQ